MMRGETELGLVVTALLRFTAFVCVAAFSLPGCSRHDETASPNSMLPQADAPLGVGAVAPDFEAVAHNGQQLKLSDLRGKVVILYFYPKDGTPGCTTEAESFRDSHQDIEDSGAVVLGVSIQSNDSHRKFAEKLKLPFLLLPDQDASIARAFGVGSLIFGFTERVTFIIDREGRIARVYERVSPPGHATEIVAALKEMNLDVPEDAIDSQDDPAAEPSTDESASQPEDSAEPQDEEAEPGDAPASEPEGSGS